MGADRKFAVSLCVSACRPSRQANAHGAPVVLGMPVLRLHLCPRSLHCCEGRLSVCDVPRVAARAAASCPAGDLWCHGKDGKDCVHPGAGKLGGAGVAQAGRQAAATWWALAAHACGPLLPPTLHPPQVRLCLDRKDFVRAQVRGSGVTAAAGVQPVVAAICVPTGMCGCGCGWVWVGGCVCGGGGGGGGTCAAGPAGAPQNTRTPTPCRTPCRCPLGTVSQ